MGEVESLASKSGYSELDELDDRDDIDDHFGDDDDELE
jgi:hypothetical protein